MGWSRKGIPSNSIKVHLRTLTASAPPLPSSLSCQTSAPSDKAVYTASLDTLSGSHTGGLEVGASPLLLWTGTLSPPLSEALYPSHHLPRLPFLPRRHSPKHCTLPSSHSRALDCSQLFICSFSQQRHGAIMCFAWASELENRLGRLPLPRAVMSQHS